MATGVKSIVKHFEPFFIASVCEQRVAGSLMSVRESVFQSKMGMNIFDPVVVIDRKAVNCAEPQHCCEIQCQVAFPCLGEITYG